jgi:hypothetical protein
MRDAAASFMSVFAGAQAGALNNPARDVDFQAKFRGNEESQIKVAAVIVDMMGHIGLVRGLAFDYINHVNLSVLARQAVARLPGIFSRWSGILGGGH